jgi:hypothetical protein
MTGTASFSAFRLPVVNNAPIACYIHPLDFDGAERCDDAGASWSLVFVEGN